LIFLPNRVDGPMPSVEKKGAPLRSLLRTPAVVGVVAFTFFNAAGRGGLMVFLPLYAPTAGISPSETGILLTVNIFLIALLQAPFGDLADRTDRTVLVLLGAAVSSAALVALPYSGSFAVLLGIAAVIGVGSALQQPSIMAMTVIAGKDHGMGSAMGIYNTAMSVGMVVAPLFGGAIMDFASIDWVFYVGGLIGIAGPLLFAGILRCASPARRA
jgi:MFS family permease